MDFPSDLYEGPAEILASGETFRVTVTLGRPPRPAPGAPTFPVSRPYGPVTFIGHYTLDDDAQGAAFKEAVETSARQHEPETLCLPNGREHKIEIDLEYFEGFGPWVSG